MKVMCLTYLTPRIKILTEFQYPVFFHQVLLAVVAAASARPQFFPFTSPVVRVKSAGDDPTAFPVAQTYTANFPHPFNFAAYPNYYGTFPNTYTAGAFPYNYFPQYTNPIVTATNFKPVEAKDRKKRSTPDTPGRTTAIHYAGTPVFPTTYGNFQTFPTTTYTYPYTYTPSVTPYAFPAGVPNPSFINPYPFVYSNTFEDKDDK